MRQLTKGRFRAALVLALALNFGAGTLAAKEVALSIDQARTVGMQALASGDAALAARIARGLLQRDAQDYDALMLLGWAEIALKHPAAARAAASRAFAAAKGKPPERFAAARLAAKGAFDEDRLTLASFWLRRAGDAASTPEERAEAVAGFRNVQAQNKWTNRLSFSISPSSNINGGSVNERLTVDGRPTGFTLNANAMALSGFEATVDLSTSYRISAGPKQLTMVGLRAFGSTYTLSKTAQQETAALGTKGRDFAFGAIEASLRQQRAPLWGKGVLSFGVTLGKTWYGGNPLSHYARVDLARSFPVGQVMHAQLSGSLEQSWSERGDDETLLGSVQGQVTRSMPTGGTLQLSLGVSGVSSPDPSNEYTSVRGAVSYALAQPIGPAEVTLGMGVSARHYPSTFTGSLFGNKERNDLRLSATVEVFLPEAEVMGFAPTVTFSAGRTWSNASRFETQDLGVAFGLKSTF